MRLALLLIVLAAVVGLALFFIDLGPRAGPQTPLEDEQAAEEGAAPGLRSAGTEGAARAATEAETARRIREEQAGGPQPPAGPPASPHVLRGRVEGLPAEEVAAARVHVQALGEYDWLRSDPEAVKGSLEADGSFAVAIGAWRAADEGVERVQVHVEHPHYVGTPQKLHLQAVGQAETRLAAPLVMRRALRIEGTVEGPDGKPLPAARVALLAAGPTGLKLDAEHDPVVLDRTAAGAEGRFALRTDAVGKVWLVATAPGGSVTGPGADAHASPPLPLGRTLVLSMGSNPPHQTLRLEAGRTIRGRVTLNGKPIKGATVFSNLVEAKEVTRLHGVDADYLAGEAVAESSGATTDKEGRFTLRGLGARPRRVSVGGIEGHYVRARSMGWKPIPVTAPADGIDLDLVAAVLDIEIRSEGELLPDARIGMRESENSWSSTRTVPKGTIRMLLPAGKRMIVTASKDRHKSVERTIEAPAAGGVLAELFDLGARTAGASLRVTLRYADGTPVTKAGFLLTEADDVDHHMGFESGLGLKRSEDGIYHLEDLEPGERLLVVSPGRSPDDHRGHDLSIAQRIMLVGGREAEASLVAQKGARVELSVRGADGEFLECGATLRDGGGQELSTSWFYASENSATVSSGGPGAAKSTMIPPIAAGAYELELSASGYESQKVGFRVTEGQTKELEVTLLKR